MNNINAQNDIKDFFCVDTILKIDKILLKDISSREIVFEVKNDVIIFNLSSENKNSIPIGIYNKTKKSYSEIDLNVPNNITISERSNIINIRVSNKRIIIFYSRYYLTFNLNIDKLEATYENITYLDKDYSQYYLIKDSIIFCYKVYNSSIGEKVYISKYNLFENRSIKHIEPKFDCILFSHFSPNHWIDINENSIVFSQACDYSISVLNHDFEVVSNINRKISNWKRLNDDTVEIYNNKRPMQILKDLSFINSHKASKIEGVWFINDTTFVVKYYLSENPDQPLSTRYFDIYILKDNVYKLDYSNLTDGGVKLNIDEITKKCNSYLLSWTNECLFSNNQFIILKSTVPIEYFNRKLGEVFNEQSNYMKSKPPYTGVWIYKWNETKNK
jgi:hypothetical protein